jgi:hypothetical protein
MKKNQVIEVAKTSGFQMVNSRRFLIENNAGKLILSDEGAEESGELAFRIIGQDIYGRQAWAIGFQFEVPTGVVIAALQSAQAALALAGLELR